MDAARVVKLPDSVTDQDAAALMLKGLTAWFLLRRCHRVRRNEPILLHAAAGGVGLIALQWAAAHWSESDCGRRQRRKSSSRP